MLTDVFVDLKYFLLIVFVLPSYRGDAVGIDTPISWLPEDDRLGLQPDFALVLALGLGTELQAGAKRYTLCQQSGPLP